MSYERKTAEAIGEFSRMKFAWGRCDCCVFVASVVNRVHGINFMAGWDYSSRYEAQTMLNLFNGLEGIVTHVLGTPVPKSELVDGEPVLAVDGKGVQLLGVKFQQRAVFKTMRGVTTLWLDDTHVLRGWMVRCQQQ